MNFVQWSFSEQSMSLNNTANPQQLSGPSVSNILTLPGLSDLGKVKLEEPPLPTVKDLRGQYALPIVKLCHIYLLMRMGIIFPKTISSHYIRWISFMEELVGWMFWILRPLETLFQSVSSLPPEKGRKKREKNDRQKKNPNNPHLHLLQAQKALPYYHLT